MALWKECQKAGDCPSLIAQAEAHGGAWWGPQRGLRLLNMSLRTVPPIPGPGTAAPAEPSHFTLWKPEAQGPGQPATSNGWENMKIPILHMEIRREVKGPVWGLDSADGASHICPTPLLPPPHRDSNPQETIKSVRSTRFNIKIFPLKKKSTRIGKFDGIQNSTSAV